MIGATWILAFLLTMFSSNGMGYKEPKPTLNRGYKLSKNFNLPKVVKKRRPKRKISPPLRWQTRRQFEILKSKADRGYIKSSTKEQILHLRIVAGIEHPHITTSLFILSFLGVFILLFCLTGDVEYLIPGGLFFPVFLNVGVRTKEILGTNIVEAYDPEFGAINNDTKLTAVISYCQTNNRRNIYLGNESWSITAQVEIPQNTEDWIITGYGLNNTTLTSTVAGGDHVFITGYQAAPLERVEHLILSRFRVTGSGAEGAGFYFNRTIHVSAIQVKFDNMGTHGIWGNYLIQSYFQDSYFEDNGTSGIQMTYCNNVTYLAVWLVGNAYGTQIRLSNGNSVIGSVIEGNTASGGLIGGGIGVNNSVVSCWLEANGGDANEYNLSVYGAAAGANVESTTIAHCLIRGNAHTQIGLGIGWAEGTQVIYNHFDTHTLRSIEVGILGRTDNNTVIKDNYVKDTTFTLINSVAVTYCRFGINIYDGTTTILTDNGLYTLLPTMEYSWLQNKSGGALAYGDVVVYDPTNDDGFTTTTTLGDPQVRGIVYATTVADDAWCYVVEEGEVGRVKVNGIVDIAIGDFLETYSDAGIARKALEGVGFAIAKATYTTDDSNGQIEAILVTPRDPTEMAIGGKYFYSATGVDNTLVTILPAGTVSNNLDYSASGDEIGAAGIIDAEGNLQPANSIAIYDDGVDVLTLAVTAGGAVTHQRTAGAVTFNLQLDLKFT